MAKRTNDEDGLEVADSKTLKMYFEKVLKKGVRADISMVPSEFALLYTESRKLWEIMEKQVMYHAFIRMYQSALREYDLINPTTGKRFYDVKTKQSTLTPEAFVNLFKSKGYDIFEQIRKGFWDIWRNQVEIPMVTSHYIQIRDSAMFTGYGVSAVANISTGRALHRDKTLAPSDASQILIFRHEMLGLERSGRIEEVVGPMGSGKSNYMCWRSIKLIAKGHFIITNASLINLTPKQEKYVFRTNRLSEAYDKTIDLRVKGFKGLIFWMLDEQAGSASGSASEKTTTLEYTYMQDVLVTIRKQGVFIVRLRQTEKVPDAQKTWISIVTRKTTDHPELAKLEFIQNTKIEETIEFRTDDVREYYDTNYKAIWIPDLDTKKLQNFMNAYLEKNKNNKDYRDINALAEAVNILMKQVKVQDQLNLIKVEQNTKEIEQAYNTIFPSEEMLKQMAEQQRLEEEQESERQEQIRQQRVEQAKKMREKRLHKYE
jgi:hypothetical protein